MSEYRKDGGYSLIGDEPILKELRKKRDYSELLLERAMALKRKESPNGSGIILKGGTEDVPFIKNAHDEWRNAHRDYRKDFKAKGFIEDHTSLNDTILFRGGLSRPIPKDVMPEIPASVRQKYLRLLKSIAPIIKPVGYGLTALGAAGYADQAGAAVDMATGPIGGVEEMGVSPEQKMLDQRYLQKIRSMQQGKK